MKEFPMLMVLLIGTFLGCYAQRRGAQIRLTKQALNYVLNDELGKLQRDLKRRSFDQSGRSGDVHYTLLNTRITALQFSRHGISTVPGVGVRAYVNGASVAISGKVRYRYKKGWFKFGDTIGLSAKASNINFQLSLGFGADSAGHPTIISQSCNDHVGSVHVRFHGGMSWIYNLFSGMVESRLKDKLNGVLCDAAIKAIDKNVKPALANFPVTKKIDRWAIIDYRLTGAPTVTTEYVDIYVKGEFKSVERPKETTLAYSQFTTSNEADRMVFFWLSEFTANTAGEVYHNTGRLWINIQGWDAKVDEKILNLAGINLGGLGKASGRTFGGFWWFFNKSANSSKISSLKVPEKTRRFLNTKSLKLIEPSTYRKYPDAPIGITLRSYKAPRCNITSRGVQFGIFIRADFVVRTKVSTLPILGMNMDVGLTVIVDIKNEKVTAQIRDDTFSYHVDVDSQYKELVDIPLNSPFMHQLLKTLIAKKVNVQLKQGLPLPNLGNTRLKDTTILFEQNAVRIGSNVELRL